MKVITTRNKFIYIYIYIWKNGESDKMIKISGKLDKSNTYNWFNDNISFFINRTSSDKTFFAFFYILAIQGVDELGGERKKV